jgi:MFS family permease
VFDALDEKQRAKAMASFMAAMPLSNVIGAPLSQAISAHIQWGGLPGWRWIYILEGLAPVLAGFFVLFCLPDRPSTAAWLPSEERSWLHGELEKERLAKATREHGAWRRHIGIVALLTLFYFCQNIVSYGMSTFMPSIAKAIVHTDETKAAWLTSLFFLTGFVVMPERGIRPHSGAHLARGRFDADHWRGTVSGESAPKLAKFKCLRADPDGRRLPVLAHPVVLGDPDHISWLHRGGVRDRIHQHDGQYGRLRGAGDRRRRGGGGGLCHGARQDCHFSGHRRGADRHDRAAGQATQR